MTHQVNVNDIVAFLVEVGALILLGMWAWGIAQSELWVRLLTTALVVCIAMVLWGLFASPQATFQQPALAIAVKVLVLGGSILCAYAIASNNPLVGFWAVVVVLNTTLIYVGPFARQDQFA